MRNTRHIFRSDRILFLVLMLGLFTARAEAQGDPPAQGAISAQAQARERAAYTNPAVAGDYPDPSVIRVGRDYWATATSSEWAPEFPILHSRDLVNWRIVGAVFQQRPAWSVGNYWAPEISEYRGRYYIYYVARKKGEPQKDGTQKEGPLCVAVASAARPDGPYKDHGPIVCQEAGSIDPMAITDERGQLYLVWKEDGNSRNLPTPIWAQRLSANGTRLVGERKELIRNNAPWEAQLVEGPFIVRRGGWFYMFYSGNACCTRDCNYAMGVARSRALLGPWEKNLANPILKANEAWKCPGHGSIVSDATGRDFLLYHAYRAGDFVYVGRQALLDEVRWNADGWPSINEGAGPSTREISPLRVAEKDEEYNFVDRFASRRLIPGWQWPQSNEPSYRLMSAPRSHLILAPTTEHANDAIGAILARSTTTGDYTASTLVDTNEMSAGTIAGLSAYGDHDNALGIAVGDGKIIVWRREKKDHKIIATKDAPNSKLIHLRIRARQGHLFRLAFSTNARDWSKVGEELDGSYLPPWDRGVRVALTCGGAEGASARFQEMRITALR
jgi:xylan 1,4-beta-xylosidase